MSDDNKNPNNSEHGKDSHPRTGQESQDASRHLKDALHHKYHRDPQPSGADETDGQRSQARAQQDSVDMQQIEGQQPEIPKVGSCDAPGG